MMNHLVLIGINFQLKRSSGDKNFWVEMIPLMSAGCRKITILSLRRHHVSYEHIEINGIKIIIRYLVPRFLCDNSTDNYSIRNLFCRPGAFPRIIGVIEKYFSTKQLCSLLSDIYHKDPYDHVHLMDNFGFANKHIARTIDTNLSISAMGYQSKLSKEIYHQFLKHCYIDKKITVVPYSKAYLDLLLRIGIKQEMMQRISWGVKLEPTLSKVSTRDDVPLILWSGYIQQIQKNDFFYAYNTALAALNQGLRAKFCFAFKPECFEDDFVSLHNPDHGISVCRTTLSEFNSLKLQASIFYSPVTNSNIILAPPLTWLEMMSQGVPILTTDVPGVDEAIIDSISGWVARGTYELLQKLFQAVETFDKMDTSTINVINEKYNVRISAKNYLELWDRLASVGRSKS